MKTNKKLLIVLFGSLAIFAVGFVFAPKVSAADATSPKLTDVKMVAVDVFGITPGVSFLWKTDEKTNGKIDYGTVSGSYISSISEIYTGLLEHSAAVTNLAYNTTYYFRVQATDLLGNSVNSKEFTYKTPIQELEIKSVKILDVLTDSAIIEVVLNRKGVINITAKNEAGEAVGKSYYLSSESAYTDKGVLILKGFSPSTSYTISVGASYEVYNQNDNDAYPYDLMTSAIMTKSLTTTSVPEITKVNKLKGVVGSIIAIHGKNFGKDLDHAAQKLVASVGCAISSDGKTSCPAEVVAWTDSEIQLRVTEGSKSGTIYLLNTYGYDDYLINRGDISFLDTYYFPVVALPDSDISAEQNAMLKFTVAGIASKVTITKAYGCGFSITARKAVTKHAKSIRIRKLFRQGDAIDTHLKSVYDAYKTNWKRAPRCHELQFHYDHKTPILKLVTWLKGINPKN